MTGTVPQDDVARGQPETIAMTADNDQTKPAPSEFDFSAYPRDTLFHDRREGRERRHRGDAGEPKPTTPRSEIPERRQKKERRRRIDPTTFEKQYSDEEMEFMNAMQRFKELTGKAFPSHGDVLKVAIMLGYRRATFEFDLPMVGDGDDDSEPTIILSSTDHN
jgi:hypothetical protein